MTGKEKYFKVLGIEPTTNRAVIKKAYRKLALKYHPDRNKSADAHLKFIQITEAYEVITGQRILRKKRVQPKPKTKEEILAEKVARAKARWQRMQAEEEIRDRRYFKRVSTGWKWRFFQAFAIYTAVFGILLSLDYFLDGRKETVNYYDMYKDPYSKSIRVGREYFHVDTPEFWSNGTPPIRKNYSYLFNDLKSVSVLISDLPQYDEGSHSSIMKNYILFTGKELYSTYSYRSIYGVFPFLHIMFLAPLMVAIFRRPTLRFSIWRLVSIWIIYPTIIFFTFSNDRIFNLIELIIEP